MASADARSPGADDRSGWRGLGYAVMVCAAGATLALYAVTRVWTVWLIPRPGLSELRQTRTGAAALPWLPALALAALAAAGALLATRGAARRVLGAAVGLTGFMIAVGALVGRVRLDAGAAGAGAVAWPAACMVGGMLVMLGGWRAVRQGHRWAEMGARYDRRAPRRSASQARCSGPADAREVWDALDRGEDPTVT